jgi:tetratricopeptide (TPR) repeat protein
LATPPPGKNIADCTKAITEEPTAEAYRSRAEAYSLAKMHEQAIQDLNEALKLEPRNANLLARRGWEYKILKHNELAIEDVNEALRLDRKSVFALLARGLIYKDIGYLDKAIDDFTRLIQIAPAPMSYNFRAQCYLAQGSSDKALDDIGRAFLTMSHFKFYALLVYALMIMFGTYSILTPDLNVLTIITIWILLIPVGLLFGVGLLYKFSLAYLLKFHELLRERNSFAAQFSEYALIFGRATRNIFILKELYPHTLAARSQYLERTGNGKEALALAKERFEWQQNSGDWLSAAVTGSLLVHLLERTGELSHADALDDQIISVLKRAYLEDESQASKYAAALFNKGQILRQLRQYPKALETLQEAYSLKQKDGANQNFDAYLICIGNLYTKLGRYDEAETTLKKIKRSESGDTKIDHILEGSVLRFLAEVEIERGNLDKAEALALEASAQLSMVDPTEQGNTAGFDATWGRLRAMQKKFSEAEQSFKKCVATAQKFQSEQHPSLLNVLLPYQDMLVEEHRTAEAEALQKQIDSIKRLHKIE